jgi:hypothetical protein
MVNWTRHILEASGDSATICAWHMGNLTFQAYSANVFKPSKGWKLWLPGQRRSHCRPPVYGIYKIMRRA